MYLADQISYRTAIVFGKWKTIGKLPQKQKSGKYLFLAKAALPFRDKTKAGAYRSSERVRLRSELPKYLRKIPYLWNNSAALIF